MHEFEPGIARRQVDGVGPRKGDSALSQSKSEIGPKRGYHLVCAWFTQGPTRVVCPNQKRLAAPEVQRRNRGQEN